MVDDIHRDEQFTDGLDEAIRLARTAYRKYQTKSDATQLKTMLPAFADIAGHTRDLLGVADDHQAHSEDLDELNFDDLLEHFAKAGRRLDTYPEEAPIEDFQMAADHYLSLLEKLSKYALPQTRVGWVQRIAIDDENRIDDQIRTR